MKETIKWASVIVTVLAAVTISFKLTPVWVSYCIFLLGHVSMVFVMIKSRDWSILSMNIIWVIIDIVGFINWF